MNGAVEEVEEATPLIEDSGFVLLLCQLVVDVLKLNGFGVVVVGYTADSIREHTLKRNGLLGSLGNTGVLFCSLIRCLYLSAFLTGEFAGQAHFSCLFLFRKQAAEFLCDKQSLLPPVPAPADASEHRNSCWSGTDAPLGE